MLGLSTTRAPRVILCLGAHSDDIEIGCGGTLLSLVKRYPSAHIVWAVFSADAQRASEARASAGAYLRGTTHSLVLSTFRDGFFPSQLEPIKERFEALKSDFRPDLIFTHRGDDAHQDHRALSQLTWNTFRDNLILEYEIPKWDGDLKTPSIYVALDLKQAQRKTALLMRHFGTQRNKHWFTPETFNGLMRIRGLECASPSGYAEGFFGRKVRLEV
jgi:LmbE family N-acetylglucosaminyl deacetylase